MLVDNGEALQLLTGVKHKVVRPYVVRFERLNRAAAWSPLLAVVAAFSALAARRAAKSDRPIWTHLGPAASQEDVDVAVLIPRILAVNEVDLL
jgi:hypothetical protein